MPAPQMFPAFFNAMDDMELRGAPFHVYLYLAKRLELMHFREVKLTEVAHEARVNERTAAWAIDRLRESGYIERGEKMNRVWTYRLIWSLEPKAAAPLQREA